MRASVRDAVLLHDRLASPWKIGYARITEFTQTHPKDLGNELDKLEKAGMKAFILDLPDQSRRPHRLRRGRVR